MLEHYVSIGFLGVILMPVAIFFLTLLQVIGRDISMMISQERQKLIYMEDLEESTPLYKLTKSK